MNHDNTIPSVLSPMSGPEPGFGRSPQAASGTPILKLVFWGVVVIVLVSAVRFFTR